MANTKITNPELFNLGDSTSATQLPVMTTTQRIAMTGLSVGEMIFNSTTDKVEYWDGAKWYGITYFVPYNGIVVGASGSNTLNFSADGINWTGLGNSIFSTQGHKSAYNGSMWVAAGRGTNALAYSTDGINWTGRGTPGGALLFDVSWNGSIFIAAGGSTDYVVTSTDGITWSAPTSSLNNYGRGVGVSPAPNLYPPI